MKAKKKTERKNSLEKIFLSGCVICFASVAAFSQAYCNFNNNGIVAGNPDYMLVHDLDAKPLVGTNWVAQLYYGAQGSPENTLLPVTNAPAHFRQPTTSYPGTWSGGSRFFVGFDDVGTVTVQVKVWDIALFPTYESAFGAGGITGKSILFDQSYCIGCGAPPAWAVMSYFLGFALVPGMPLLSVAVSGNQNQLVLTWPTNVVGFTLQSSPSLGSDATWTDCPNAVLAGNQYLMIATVSSTNQFYRLKK